ncbi:MAG: hypothetical protein BJ554DRAFT_653, partial [Olpidium bornovanus]
SSRYGKRRRDELLSSEESEWESGDEAANLRPKLATGANYLTAPLGLKSAPQRDPCVKTAGAVSTPKKRLKKEERERVDAATQTEAGQMAGVGEPIGTPANGETKGKRPERTGIPPLPSSAEKPAQGKEADGSQSRRSLPQSAQVARLGLQPQSTSAAQLQPREQLDVQPPRSDEEYAFDPEFTKESTGCPLRVSLMFANIGKDRVVIPQGQRLLFLLRLPGVTDAPLTAKRLTAAFSSATFFLVFFGLLQKWKARPHTKIMLPASLHGRCT